MSKDSQFIFHFHGSVGQQIARVEKMVVNFDKDMNMHIEQVGEKQENTKHLSAQELFNLLNEHFGLDYGIRNFTKYRDKFSSI